MVRNPVIILGAGATKACGGPLTDEILPAALNGEIIQDERTSRVRDREELLQFTRDFLGECFNVPVDRNSVRKEDCPPLPFVLSILRQSVDSRKPLGKNWKGERLIQAKRAIEYSAFAVIEAALRRIPQNRQLHHNLLKSLYTRGVEPTVISLNYDVIVDNAMFHLSDLHQHSHPPDYRVDIETDQYNEFTRHGTFGNLLKIHGTLNWLYCENCKRLDLFVSRGLRGGYESHNLRTSKALSELYSAGPFRDTYKDAYQYRSAKCQNYLQCGGYVSPILITPTYVKDYKNPHVKKVWKEAELRMRKADRAVFIGYSLPTDDVEIAMLFKRGLDQLPSNRITVVEYVHSDVNKTKKRRTPMGQHPTGQRFRFLFGPDIDWHTTGFEGWLREQGDIVFD